MGVAKFYEGTANYYVILNAYFEGKSRGVNKADLIVRVEEWRISFKDFGMMLLVPAKRETLFIMRIFFDSVAFKNKIYISFHKN